MSKFNSMAYIMPKITKKAREKMPHYLGSLMLDWDKIIGTYMSPYLKISHVTFPKDKEYGTIYLFAHPTRSAEYPHFESLFLDKINNWIGYKAIDKMIFKRSYFQVILPSPKKQVEKEEKPASLEEALKNLERHIPPSDN